MQLRLLVLALVLLVLVLVLLPLLLLPLSPPLPGVEDRPHQVLQREQGLAKGCYFPERPLELRSPTPSNKKRRFQVGGFR